MSVRRKNVMLGTAGHVDHGKTALVKLLTGCETDTLAEEKQRGLTIDLGFAPCRLADDRVVGIVDVPGHVDFIRNMVAGAHGIDVVILVVAADDGVMPQTQEHLHILTLMGVRHGLVALSKIDLVDPSRHDRVQSDLRRLLDGTFLQQAPVCPISNVTGEGFEAFFSALNQVVDACAERPCSGLFRLWIEDAFTIRGSGTVVTGIPLGGVVRTGDQLRLLPPGITGRVRRLQVYGEDTTEGRAGECVALNLADIDLQTIRRGMALAESDFFPSTCLAEAHFQTLPTLATRIKDLAEVHLHVGTASVPAHVAMLETAEMGAGQGQMIQLRFGQPLPLSPGDRFVLRANVGSSDQGGLVTIGGGRVLGTSNRRLRRQRPWTLRMLQARHHALDHPTRWCELMLQENSRPVGREDLRKRCRVRPDELEAVLEHLRTSHRLLQTRQGALVHAAAVEQAAAGLLAELETFHRANPESAGMTVDTLVSAVPAHHEIASLAIDKLLQAGRLRHHGSVVALPGRGAELPAAEQRLCERVETAYRQAGWVSPSLPELATSMREPAERLNKLIQILTERGILVRLDEQLALHREAVESAKQVALRLFARGSSFSTMQFRDALGVSRKYAVPLLDHLDAVRFTVRTGNNRTPGVEARKLMG